ncbi:hypothetical protein AB0P17_29605 [Streptomyces sp. NPDC088124]|uniref:hypothetical protein n=1 Tax=Streptomyces sp. NPDC088124 TaxID=3154654 RepID=UPI0034455794
MKFCLRLTTGSRVPSAPPRVDVHTALKALRVYEQKRADPRWSVHQQTYTDHVTVICTSTRSGLTDVLRVPHGVALLTDGRYKISHTWIGRPVQGWAVWFCNEYLGDYATDIEAAEALLIYRRDIQKLSV